MAMSVITRLIATEISPATFEVGVTVPVPSAQIEVLETVVSMEPQRCDLECLGSSTRAQILMAEWKMWDQIADFVGHGLKIDSALFMAKNKREAASCIPFDF